MITKSLNDGAGASPATTLSCARSSTASSMSTSSVITKSGAVALDSAIRRATVRCRRVSSWCSTSPRPPCVGRRALLRRLLGGPPLRCSAGSLLAAGAASTSDFTIRPPGPVPSIVGEVDARSSAIRRAIGEALTRSSPLVVRPRAPALRARLVLRLVLGVVLRRLVLVVVRVVGLVVGVVRRPSSSASSPASSSVVLVLVGLVVLVARRRRPTTPPPSPIFAIVSPTGERVALLGHDLERPRLVGLVGHVGLVRLDLDELFALGDLVAVGLEPLEDRALFHRVGQAGHGDVGHGAQYYPEEA